MVGPFIFNSLLSNRREMSKQFRVSLDPLILKPVIEAMIFASEEPLSGRALIRLLAGDRETESDDGAEAAETDGAPRDTEAPDAVAGADVSAEEAIAEEETIAEEAAVEEEAVTADASSLDASIAYAASVDRADDEEAGDGEAAADEGAGTDDASGADDTVEAEDVPPGDLAGSPKELAEAVERAEARKASKRTGSPGLDVLTVRALVAELNEEYEITGRAFRIVEVAGGYQFATTRDYGEFVALMAKEKLRRRLSPAALETLAIIAYRQPVSKPEVEAIRGVNCDQVLVNLMEKNLVVITGRSEGVGRPLLYGTTEDFLRSFGLKGIGDLPKLREIEELMEEGTYSAERAEVITVDANTGAEEIEARVGAAGHAEHPEAEHSEAEQSAADGDADNQHGSIELVAEESDTTPPSADADADDFEAVEIAEEDVENDDEPDDEDDAEEIEDDGGGDEDEEDLDDDEDDDEGDEDLDDDEPDDDDEVIDDESEDEEDEGDEELDGESDDGEGDVEAMSDDEEPADEGDDEEGAERASGVGADGEPVMVEPGEADE